MTFLFSSQHQILPLVHNIHISLTEYPENLETFPINKLHLSKLVGSNSNRSTTPVATAHLSIASLYQGRLIIWAVCIIARQTVYRTFLAIEGKNKRRDLMLTGHMFT